MLLRLGLGAAVVTLTAASAWNNWQHMRSFGLGVAILVIAAEVAKPLLPVALIEHGKNRASLQWCGTLLLWCIIVAFSFVNTFGNALTRHAKDKARQGIVAASATRPEHVILRELASVKSCPDKEETRDEVQPAKGKKKAIVLQVKVRVPDTECAQKVAADKLALTAELTESKRREANALDAPIDKNTVTDGYIELARMAGWEPQRYQIDTYTVLLWTLLAELGSALGGLCIPRSRE
jgi:hypothetical protein